MTLAKSKELEISKDKCYLDLGEWSLASVKKKLGPFSFELTSYKFGYESKKLSLDVEGKIGFWSRSRHLQRPDDAQRPDRHRRL